MSSEERTNTIGEAMDKLFTSIGQVICQLALLVSMFLWNAFVLIKMWAWFILVLFPAFPKLNYPTAIGLMVTISVLMRRSADRNKKTDYLMAFALPAVSLLVGWITHLFM